MQEKTKENCTLTGIVWLPCKLLIAACASWWELNFTKAQPETKSIKKTNVTEKANRVFVPNIKIIYKKNHFTGSLLQKKKVFFFLLRPIPLFIPPIPKLITLAPPLQVQAFIFFPTSSKQKLTAEADPLKGRLIGSTHSQIFKFFFSFFPPPSIFEKQDRR